MYSGKLCMERAPGTCYPSCSLPKGHDGKHVAYLGHDATRGQMSEWRNTEDTTLGNAQMTFFWTVDSQVTTNGGGIKVQIVAPNDEEYRHMTIHLEPEAAKCLPVGSKVRVQVNSI
jgi:hypothetical protein